MSRTLPSTLLTWVIILEPCGAAWYGCGTTTGHPTRISGYFKNILIGDRAVDTAGYVCTILLKQDRWTACLFEFF